LLVYSFIHSFIHWVIYLFIHLLISGHLFGHLFIRSFIHWFSHSFIHWFSLLFLRHHTVPPIRLKPLLFSLSLSPSLTFSFSVRLSSSYTLSLPFISPPTSQCSVSLSCSVSLFFPLCLSPSLSLFGVLKLQFGLLSVCALPVSFLCRPEPPAEPGTPAHSTAGKTPACYTTTQESYGMTKNGKTRNCLMGWSQKGEQVPQTALKEVIQKVQW